MILNNAGGRTGMLIRGLKTASAYTALVLQSTQCLAHCPEYCRVEAASYQVLRIAQTGDLLDHWEAARVAKVFPASANGNVITNWPIVVREMRAATMGNDRDLLFYVIATIRTETTNFSTRPERENRFSRVTEHASYAGIAGPAVLRPFGAYDSTIRVARDGEIVINKHLGNRFYYGIDDQLMRSRHGDAPRQDFDDGARYRGRGFIQITGRENYTKMQARLNDKSIDIVNDPESAEKPEIAARILVQFISARRTRIVGFMRGGNYKSARQVINERGEGYETFRSTISKLQAILTIDLALNCIHLRVSTGSDHQCRKTVAHRGRSPCVDSD